MTNYARQPNDADCPASYSSGAVGYRPTRLRRRSASGGRLVGAFNAAVNAHHVDAALAFFADDALVQFPNQPPPNSHRGTSEIRAWLQADAAQHIRLQTDNLQMAGDRVTGIGRVEVDTLRPVGITLEGPVETVVQGGKITSFTFTLSQDTLAKLQAATAQPQGLPQTGGAGLNFNWLLILAGLSICGLGVALRRQGVH